LNFFLIIKEILEVELYDRFLGSSNPDAWNYHGAYIQQGAFDVKSDMWMNFTLDRNTSYHTSEQELDYRNFNFMNIKYKYVLVERTTVFSSPTTMAPSITSTTEYERVGTEQRNPENE
jgi:hypothetical protein